MAVIAFAVDPFVKPRSRVVYPVKLPLINMYCTYPITRQICSLHTLVTGEMCKLRSMIRAIRARRTRG